MDPFVMGKEELNGSLLFSVNKLQESEKEMKRGILVSLALFMLCTLTVGCGQQKHTYIFIPGKIDEVTSVTENPIDYIIDEDFKEGNCLSSYNMVYQIDEWIYFPVYATLYRINVNGKQYEKLFVAEDNALIGYRITGNGKQYEKFFVSEEIASIDYMNNFAQCGQYLVFTYKNSIYKMDLTTLKVDVLVDGTKENADFQFTTKGDDIYFMPFIGADGIYKITVNDSEYEKVLSLEKEEIIYNLQISNDQIYYGIMNEGVFRVNLDGSNKEQILNPENFRWETFVVTDKYIYFLNREGSLQRADTNGKKIITLVDSCSFFNIIDDLIIYTGEFYEDNIFSATNIYKMPINKRKSVKIYEGVIFSIVGSCGNWVYFLKPKNRAMFRIRLDGTGEMQVSR